MHILKYCPEFKNITKNNNQELYYRDDIISARKTAEILQKVIQKIETVHKHKTNPKHNLTQSNANRISLTVIKDDFFFHFSSFKLYIFVYGGFHIY